MATLTYTAPVPIGMFQGLVTLNGCCSGLRVLCPVTRGSAAVAPAAAATNAAPARRNPRRDVDSWRSAPDIETRRSEDLLVLTIPNLKIQHRPQEFFMVPTPLHMFHDDPSYCFRTIEVARPTIRTHEVIAEVVTHVALEPFVNGHPKAHLGAVQDLGGKDFLHGFPQGVL